MPERDTALSLREVPRADPPEALAERAKNAPPPSVPAPVPESESTEPVPETAADSAAAGAGRYRRRGLLVLSAIVLALFLYWASSYFFAYTDDAYITSDFVDVAPYISGRVVTVNVVDNQTVKKGDVLA